LRDRLLTVVAARLFLVLFAVSAGCTAPVPSATQPTHLVSPLMGAYTLQVSWTKHLLLHYNNCGSLYCLGLVGDTTAVIGTLTVGDTAIKSGATVVFPAVSATLPTLCQCVLTVWPGWSGDPGVTSDSTGQTRFNLFNRDNALSASDIANYYALTLDGAFAGDSIVGTASWTYVWGGHTQETLSGTFRGKK
jgi:hypothetical protein